MYKSRTFEVVNTVYLTLFVACYNEEDNIRATLDTLVEALSAFSFTYEIIVIDDGSHDQSPAIVTQYIDSHPDIPIALVVNDTNRGLAQNYVEGAFRGRGEFYRLICGDNVEPVETLQEIFRHIGAADVLVPYQVECRGKSLSRRILSRVFTGLVNVISGYKLKYYNGLAVLRRYHVLRWHSNYRGFGFQADLLTRLMDEGLRVMEIPVVANERTKGTSSALRMINLFSVAHTLLDLLIRRTGTTIYSRGRSRALARRRHDREKQMLLVTTPMTRTQVDSRKWTEGPKHEKKFS